MFLVLLPIVLSQNTTNHTNADIEYYKPPTLIIYNNISCPTNHTCKEVRLMVEILNITLKERYFRRLPWRNGEASCKLRNIDDLSSAYWTCTITYSPGDIYFDDFILLPDNIADKYEDLWLAEIDNQKNINRRYKIYLGIMTIIMIIAISIAVFANVVKPRALLIGG